MKNTFLTITHTALFTLLVGVCILTPTLAEAQSNFSLFSPGDTISLRTDPAYPEPGESVTVTANGDGFSLDAATVAWSQDNTVVKEGRGETTYTFEAEDAGEITQITATIVQQNARVVSESIVINPVDMDLLWEADSYTPHLYRGKELRSPQGAARVVSFVEAYDRAGNRIPPAELFYRWEFNGRAIAELSGYGEDIFPSDVSRHENTIALEVSTRDNETIAREEVAIPNARSQVVLYRDYALQDINYNTAIGNRLQLGEEEVRLTATPYFFDTSNTNIDQLNYNWSINNDSTEATSRQIRLSKQASGETLPISLEVTHPQKRLQRAEQTIDIEMLADNELNNE